MKREHHCVSVNRSTARALPASRIPLILAGALLMMMLLALTSCTKPAAPVAQASAQLAAIPYEANVSAGGIARSNPADLQWR